ncbi:hypothetical protein SAMN05192588_1052 [Nonlabens sp. Hel1_33_55]|uniref:PIN domain-containing protein n=1 Tax=Nonlabens sp. Hel1_33_55 TaxID=1336802 RepID=UPI000875E3C7|nr:PIN domain-containing protein [Nonlabens sp. Hel1_33_55]SCY08339.1 hypothetical protein SAMN05192588_1052 [Nonlabens sp. Hel1_33_55]
MTDVILDTNIWISHIAKDKPNGIFDSFKSQVDNGEIFLLINDIILDEWQRNKSNTIRDITNEIKSSSKNALRMKTFLDENGKQKIDELLSDYNSKEEERIKLAEQRIEQVEKLMTNATKVIVTNEMKIRVADWALEKRAPFKQKSNSVGDALILLSTVEHRNSDSTSHFRPGFFISFNHTDYAQRENSDEIHEDLQELLDGANLSYKRNIGEVLSLTPELNAEVESYIDYQVESYMEDQAEIRRGK